MRCPNCLRIVLRYDAPEVLMCEPDVLPTYALCRECCKLSDHSGCKFGGRKDRPILLDEIERKPLPRPRHRKT